MLKSVADLEALPRGTVIHAIHPQSPRSVGTVALRHAALGRTVWLVTGSQFLQTSEQLVDAMLDAEWTVLSPAPDLAELEAARQFVAGWRDDDVELRIPSNQFGDDLSEAVNVLLEATSTSGR